MTATEWTSSCAWCATTITTPTPQTWCSRRCADRHRWYGIRPDAVGTAARRKNLARRLAEQAQTQSQDAA